MRKKLIELIGKMETNPEITCPNLSAATCEDCEYAINKNFCNMNARKADYLISNGVIVMPCKVGDTAYEIDIRYTKCTPYGERYSAYACAGCEKSCDSRKELYIRPVEITNIHWIFNMWDYYGKTWFTDPETAKKALKARNNNVSM